MTEHIRMRVKYNDTWFVIGKFAQDNWKIILEADKEHYWVHAEGVPSSHIIIEIDDPIESEIQYACQLCKLQSKKVKDTSTKFIITQVKNVKLGSTPGEVVIKDLKKTKTVTLTLT